MDNERIQKFGADKIFLFMLFALSLFLAWGIVKARSRVFLTEPIKLPYTGLSIRMPDKNGWACDDKWRFLNNSFAISSTFAPTRNERATVKCTYQLASARESANVWLKEIAAERGSEITNSGTIQGFNVAVEWVRIEKSRNYPAMVAATGKLGYGRWLDIRIDRDGANPQYVQQVFEKIAESIGYEDNKLLKEGIEIVSRIKSAGLSRFMNFPDEPSMYLIQKTAQMDVGFTIQSCVISQDQQENEEVQTRDFAYLQRSEVSPGRILIGGDSFLQEETFFRSDNYLREYVFSSLSNLTGENTVTVSDSNLAGVRILAPGIQQYQQKLGPAAVPQAVLEAVFTPMLTNDKNRILIDILNSKGQVQPVLISVKEKDQRQNEDFRYVFEIAYMGENSFEKFYLNRSMQTVKREIKQNSLQLLMTLSDAESLTHRFPERAGFIVETIKSLKKK